MANILDLIKKLCPNGVEYKKLGEVCEVRNGYTPSKLNKSFWDKKEVNWFTLKDIRNSGSILSSSIEKVSRSSIKSSGLFKKNSVIISTTATIGKVALVTDDFICNQQITCLSIKSKFQVIPKFLFYYSYILSSEIKKLVPNTTFVIVNKKQLTELAIPIPPISIQEEIVKKLDAFSDLVSNISIGLPAEIEARKKQYEYYREKLLAFN